MDLHTKEEREKCKNACKKNIKNYPTYMLQKGSTKHRHEHHIPSGEGFRNADNLPNSSQPPIITTEARQLTIKGNRGIRE